MSAKGISPVFKRWTRFPHTAGSHRSMLDMSKFHDIIPQNYLFPALIILPFQTGVISL
jgi:hypothetical protein